MKEELVSQSDMVTSAICQNPILLGGVLLIAISLFIFAWAKYSTKIDLPKMWAVFANCCVGIVVFMILVLCGCFPMLSLGG